MFYLGFIGVLMFVLLVLSFIRKSVLLDKVMKVLSILFMLLMFINVLLPDGFVVSLSEEELAGNNQYFEAIIRWFRFVSFLVIPIAVFYDKKIFNKIAIYFCLPIAVVNLISYFLYFPDITTSNLKGIANIRFFSEGFRIFISNDVFRSCFFGLISLLEIVILIYIVYKNNQKLKFESIKESILFIITLISLILVIMPIYIPQYLIGYTDIILKTYSLAHLMWVLSLVVIFIGLHLIFRKQTYENRFILVIVLALSLLIQYNQMFSAINELTFKRMPLQLCNIGSYLILVTLLTKNRKLFSFTLIVNVVGALVALSILGVDEKGLGYLWNMHYILEHSGVVIIPLLCLSLGLFPKVEKEDIKYVLIGFISYFIFVLGLGTYLNGIFASTGNDFFEVNYLFMFDREVAADAIGFADKLFDLKIIIGKYTYYPMIQSVVFFTFLSLCFGVFYLLYFLTNLKYKKSNIS